MEKTTSVTDKKNTARCRINNAIKRGHEIKTPFGVVKDRPESCQLCGKMPFSYGKKTIPLAHHFSYGSIVSDLFVVFVCRSCHGKIHNDKLSVVFGVAQ